MPCLSTLSCCAIVTLSHSHFIKVQSNIYFNMRITCETIQSSIWYKMSYTSFYSMNILFVFFFFFLINISLILHCCNKTNFHHCRTNKVSFQFQQATSEICIDNIYLHNTWKTLGSMVSNLNKDMWSLKRFLICFNLNKSSVSNSVQTFHWCSKIPEILSSLTTVVMQLVRQSRHQAVQVGHLQSFPHVLIRVLLKWIQVWPQRPRKQNWVLKEYRILKGKKEWQNYKIKFRSSHFWLQICTDMTFF